MTAFEVAERMSESEFRMWSVYLKFKQKKQEQARKRAESQQRAKSGARGRRRR